MKREAVNFSRIPARHDAINKRLEDWAKWVRYHPQAWKTPPLRRALCGSPSYGYIGASVTAVTEGVS